jgi:hypothetical protein
MTTTVNCSNNDSDNCVIATNTLQPDCFKLRLGFNPANIGVSGATVYDLALCNPVVVFTNPCCLSGATDIILRIPLTFSQDCSLYRVNVTLVPPESIATVYKVTNGITSTDVDVLAFYVADGYLNILIPTADIAFTESNGQCIATVTFAGFEIPLIKIANFCGCTAFCNTVNWLIGTTAPPAITTTILG